MKKNKKYDKHFMRLAEWSFFPHNLEEDDDNENNMDDGANQDIPNKDNNDDMNGNMNGDMNDNNASDSAMDTPNQGNQNDNQDNGDELSKNNDDMNSFDNASLPNNDLSNQDEMPQDNLGDLSMQDDNSTLESDDEVIDVDDITKAQEKMNTKVNKVGQNLGTVDGKIQDLMSALKKIETLLNNNNNEINKFKAEFEKRNPTQTEKLNLRSLDSYPFNVNPISYWHNKSIDRNNPYVGYMNNDESTTDEYEVTRDDINDYSPSQIENSFDVDDDLQQDLKKIFNL